MQQSRVENSKIGKELINNGLHEWFNLNYKNFLHNIDTFYYSVKLFDDFRKESKSKNVMNMRKCLSQFTEMKSLVNSKITCMYFADFQDTTLSCQHFAKYYDYCISKPDQFDIFIANDVPPAGDGGDSVTAEIIVQIRSEMLWQHPVKDCFEISLDYVLRFCRYFDFSIAEIKENRSDFCWHTNYLRNPEKFFDIRSLHEKKVSRLHEGMIHWQDNADHYDVDYITLGKRSSKIFLRIYLKSKEVVEMGYKGWFLKLWLLQGMISRYDFYCMEKCYEKKNWFYLDRARLEFYRDYGADPEIKQQIRYLLEDKKENSLQVKNLADRLTPPVTLIMNIEYQVMRRASKSFALMPVNDNSDQGPAQRVYDYLDNWQHITEYLTHDIFRMIQMDDDNRSRCSDCDFWNKLRHAPIYGGKPMQFNNPIVRQYKRNLSVEIVKKRLLSDAVTLGIYTRGIQHQSVMKDCLDGISRLNDNDLHRAQQMKEKRLLEYNEEMFIGTKYEQGCIPDSLFCDKDHWLNLMIWGSDDLYLHGQDEYYD